MLKDDFLKRMKEYLELEYDSFIKSYNDSNIRAFNINTKYISKDVFKEIFNYEINDIPYLNNSFYLTSTDVKMGFLPLHHAGAIYMQDPSAMMPVNSVDIKDDSLVLDLCSAPGGKSIQLALKCPNGAIISNEIDRERAKVLYSNIERMGLNNVVVTSNKPSDFLPNYEGVFDVVLVDAPCSGEGMFRKYPNAIIEWSLENVKECSQRDKEILDSAVKLLKKDGILIYSTCTFAKEENEDIISYLLTNYDFELVDINDELKPFLKEGFIKKTYRFYPHIASGEGQFLAVLRKRDGKVSSLKPLKNKVNNQMLNDFMNKYLNSPVNDLIVRNDDIYYCSLPYELPRLKVLNYGVKLGEIYNKRFVPNHNFFKSFSSKFKSNVSLDHRDPLVLKYLHGEQIKLDTLDGYGVLFVNNVPLGGYKATSGALNNLYPKGLRNF